MADSNNKPDESNNNFLTPQEQAICQQVAAYVTPHRQHALALLAVNEGSDQEKAAEIAGLSSEQMSDLLTEFQKNRLGIFPVVR